MELTYRHHDPIDEATTLRDQHGNTTRITQNKRSLPRNSSELSEPFLNNDHCYRPLMLPETLPTTDPVAAGPLKHLYQTSSIKCMLSIR